jgi:tRNA A-37 threonylcarbamoyl transferase component Bud32
MWPEYKLNDIFSINKKPENNAAFEAIVVEFLSARKIGEIIGSGQKKNVYAAGEEYEVTINKPIITRKRHSTKNQSGNTKVGLRHEVRCDFLASGESGVIYSTLTLIPKKDNSMEVKSKRVVKEFYNATKIEIENEAKLLSMVPYMHGKPLLETKFNDNSIFFLFMRRIPGKSIRDLGESGILSKLDTHKKIKLSLSLLRSLKQIHDKNIIHRDLKISDNILIDLANPLNPEAYIIDFSESIIKEGGDFCYDTCFLVSHLRNFIWGMIDESDAEESPHYQISTKILNILDNVISNTAINYDQLISFFKKLCSLVEERNLSVTSLEKEISTLDISLARESVNESSYVLSRINSNSSLASFFKLNNTLDRERSVESEVKKSPR